MSEKKIPMPAAEKVAEELGKAKSINDFYGKDGIFAKLFSKTIEQMLQAEMDEHLGYQKHSSKGWNSGNSRNGSYSRKIKSSAGTDDIEVPRDRNGTFKSVLLGEYGIVSNEIEDKVLIMYARGMTTGDISASLADIYGIETSDTLISQITDKILPLVEEWQSRPLDSLYVMIYLDCIHVKLRRDGKVQNTAVYTVLAVDKEGKKDILGHWVGDGGEGSNYWLNVITDIKNRGVQDVLICSVDGLKGFDDAIHSVFPDCIVQQCIIHQIRNSLKYVSWKDRKEFVRDLKLVYKATTKEEAEVNLGKLTKKWSGKYQLSIKSWQDNWENLSQFFQFTPEIRRLIYTTNIIEGYYRQIRKVTKNKGVFPTEISIRKMFYLATRDIMRKWTKPISNWPKIMNQLAIKFEGRLSYD
jgi:transposase-like protein